MCGIAGALTFHPGSKPNRAIIDKMIGALSHRGPDGSGVEVIGPAVLGHRRLSIIDIQGGHQPMCNEDGTVWVTYNGEIYNYQEIRSRLSAKGHTFRSRSDTEILVHLYEELGWDLLEELNGIFAFGLWDSKRQRLLLARDRLGIKPLYYHNHGDAFWFASEIKALRQVPGIPSDPNLGAFREYLTFRTVFGERTLFAGVRELLPGTAIEIGSGVMKTRTYWTPNMEYARAERESTSLATLDRTMSSAVHAQLMSDVPLGSFCSGGIDSSLVAGLAAENSEERLNTYCIGYGGDEAEWDERPYARLVADRYQTKHHELVVTGQRFRDGLFEARRYNDEPLSHPSSVPLYLLSQLAREKVKVVLSGEGSDEFFAGYPRHKAVLVYAAMEARLHGAGRRVVGKLLSGIPGRRISILANTLQQDKASALLLNCAFVMPSEVRALISPDVPGSWLGDRRALLMNGDQEEDMLDQLARIEIATYLPIALNRLDRMSMAHGLEARVPFLDNRLMSLALAIPPQQKLNLFTNKKAIRDLAKEYLPAAVINRRKVGFGVPVANWLHHTGSLSDQLRQLLSGTLVREGIVDRPGLEEVVKHHRNGWANNTEVLWLLMNLDAWLGELRAERLNHQEPAIVGA